MSDLSSFSTEELLLELARRQQRVEQEARLLRSAHTQRLPPVLRSADEVVATCERYYGIEHHEMIGPEKSANIVHARHMAMYILSIFNGMSREEVAAIFNRDASTVTYAVAKINEELETNIVMERELHSIKSKIGTQPY